MFRTKQLVLQESRKIRPLVSRLLSSTTTQSTIDALEHDYSLKEQRIKVVSQSHSNPMTLTEKLLYSHLSDPNSYSLDQPLLIRPDHVAIPDSIAPLLLLQLISRGVDRVRVSGSATVHCTRPLPAVEEEDQEGRQEVRELVERSSARLGLGVWAPGSGLMSQVLLERHCLPGQLVVAAAGVPDLLGSVGGLSAGQVTCTATQALACLAGHTMSVARPSQVVGVRLRGELKGWASPRDVLVRLRDIHQLPLLMSEEEKKEAGWETKLKGGGGGVAVEFFGSGLEGMSCAGQAEMCQMAVSLGAQSATTHFSARTQDFLHATARTQEADLLEKYKYSLLSADKEAEYSQVIEVDLSHLEPQVWSFSGKNHVDAWSTAEMAKGQPGWPEEIQEARVEGSCYESITRTAGVLRHTFKLGISLESPTRVALPSACLYDTLLREDHLKAFEQSGAQVMVASEDPTATGDHVHHPCEATSCPPHAGGAATACTLSSSPRSLTLLSLPADQGEGEAPAPSAGGVHLVAAPAVVTALALAGSRAFDPVSDCFLNDDGEPFCLAPPAGDQIPEGGFVSSEQLYRPPLQISDRTTTTADGEVPEDADVQFRGLDHPGEAAAAEPGFGDEYVAAGGRGVLAVDPESAYLQLIKGTKEGDAPYPEGGVASARVLVKVSGPCPASRILEGPAVQGAGAHLDRLSVGLLASLNAEVQDNGQEAVNEAESVYTTHPPHLRARQLQESGLRWVVVGDSLMGQGCGLDNSALVIKHLGGCAVISSEFSAAFETELKMQGVLPFTFLNPEDAHFVAPTDTLSLPCLESLESNSPATVEGVSESGVQYSFQVKHTLSSLQLQWIRSGGVLNTAESAHADSS